MRGSTAVMRRARTSPAGTASGSVTVLVPVGVRRRHGDVDGDVAAVDADGGDR